MSLLNMLHAWKVSCSCLLARVLNRSKLLVAHQMTCNKDTVHKSDGRALLYFCLVCCGAEIKEQAPDTLDVLNPLVRELLDAMHAACARQPGPSA